MVVEGTSRLRLQKAIADLSRASRTRGDSRRRHVTVSYARPADIREASTVEQPVRQQPEMPVGLAEVDRKLARIERMLAEMRAPGTSTSESFNRWVKQGYWAYIRFGDYLRLKRIGLL